MDVSVYMNMHRATDITYKVILYFQISAVFCHVKDLGEPRRNITKLLISGGKPARLESFPFNAQFINKGGLCSASILTSKTVLTAAHCFDYNKNIGDMAIMSAAQYVLDRHRQQHSIWEFRLHPNYNTTVVFSDDIAIILIQDFFVFGSNVQPGILTNTTNWMRENETAFLASGWGLTSENAEQSLQGLMETRLRYYSRKKCMDIYKGVPFSREMFCLYGNGTTDTCMGDSGGGILWHNMIVGVVSHGRGCVTYPGVYVNVYYYTDWIKNTTNELYRLYCSFHSFG